MLAVLCQWKQQTSRRDEQSGHWGKTRQKPDLIWGWTVGRRTPRVSQDSQHLPCAGPADHAGFGPGGAAAARPECHDNVHGLATSRAH